MHSELWKRDWNKWTNERIWQLSVYCVAPSLEVLDIRSYELFNDPTNWNNLAPTLVHCVYKGGSVMREDSSGDGYMGPNNFKRSYNNM